MPEIALVDQQLRSILTKCSARLNDIIRRSAAAAPGSKSIIPACHAELHEVIVHAVITIRPAVPNAAHFRSMISRTYATGLDGRTGAPTVESVRTITTLIDAAAGAINQRETPAIADEDQAALNDYAAVTPRPHP